MICQEWQNGDKADILNQNKQNETKHNQKNRKLAHEGQLHHRARSSQKMGMPSPRGTDRGAEKNGNANCHEDSDSERENICTIHAMNEQHKNVTAFIEQYTAGMSKEQAAAFWKKFRKAANAYAQTQAERITELEKQNNRLKTALQVIHTWASFRQGRELNHEHAIKLIERTLDTQK